MLLEEIALMITGAIQITGGKMKATVVVDNIGNDELKGEWGLCIYIEYKNEKILLDAGAS